jgi:hypothetical protein
MKFYFLLLLLIYILDYSKYGNCIKLETVNKNYNLNSKKIDIKNLSNQTYNETEVMLMTDQPQHISNNTKWNTETKFYNTLFNMTRFKQYIGYHSIPPISPMNIAYPIYNQPTQLPGMQYTPTFQPLQQNDEISYYYRDNLQTNSKLPQISLMPQPVAHIPIPHEDPNDIKILKDNHIINITIHPHPKKNLKIIPM